MVVYFEVSCAEEGAVNIDRLRIDLHVEVNEQVQIYLSS